MGASIQKAFDASRQQREASQYTMSLHPDIFDLILAVRMGDFPVLLQKLSEIDECQHPDDAMLYVELALLSGCKDPNIIETHERLDDALTDIQRECLGLSLSFYQKIHNARREPTDDD